ncbi:hypothetical protein BS78_04G101800 [Paspalum vaginatum]|nr:hypothetical protein BS78_04G101800 [Paspalum vaginatum]
MAPAAPRTNRLLLRRRAAQIKYSNLPRRHSPAFPRGAGAAACRPTAECGVTAATLDSFAVGFSSEPHAPQLLPSIQ